MSQLHAARRHDDVILVVVRYIGSSALIYGFAVALCAVLRFPVPEALVALASSAAGYLAGLLTPRPGTPPVANVEQAETVRVGETKG